MSLLTFTGDVMLGRLVNKHLGQVREPGLIWGDVLDDLHRSDATFINLECALTRNKKRGKKDSPVFFFRSKPENVTALVAAGVNWCALANNHILDFGKQALQETVEALDSAGIYHSGAGNNLAEARKPAEMEIDGMRTRVYSFTDNEPSWEARKDRPGTFYLPIDTGHEKVVSFVRDIIQSKRDGYFVVVSAHWGPNMVQKPSKKHVEFAHFLVDKGVDIFHGHSSHVFQPVEVYKNSVIFYDCGEAIDDYAVDPTLRNDQSFLYQVKVEKGSIQRPVLKPIQIEIEVGSGEVSQKIQTNRLRGEDAKVVCRKMIEMSKNFGTEMNLKEDFIEVSF